MISCGFVVIVCVGFIYVQVTSSSNIPEILGYNSQGIQSQSHLPNIVGGHVKIPGLTGISNIPQTSSFSAFQNIYPSGMNQYGWSPTPSFSPFWCRLVPPVMLNVLRQIRLLLSGPLKLFGLGHSLARCFFGIF